ncbi:MAG: hypothetical protein U0M06_04050 [Clostridia bacterium]|nr:hypothetical protein [Clostridia bacterium]
MTTVRAAEILFPVSVLCRRYRNGKDIITYTEENKELSAACFERACELDGTNLLSKLEASEEN